jgi:hypothetical protein
MNQETLTITYDIDKPIPVEELIASLQGLLIVHSQKDVRLCVKEVRKGSYIFEFINQVPDTFVAVAPIIIEGTKSMVEYTKDIRSILEFFKTGKNKEKKKFTKSDADAAHKLVTPLTVDVDSSLKISDATINGDVHIYNYTDANAIQGAANRFLEESNTSGDIRENVSLSWKNLADKESSGNKAVVPDISQRIVMTKFGSSSIYQKMVQQAPHPFKNLWEVNLHVEWHGDIPKKYTIIDVITDLGEI